MGVSIWEGSKATRMADGIELISAKLDSINNTLKKANNIGTFDGTAKTYNRVMKEWFDDQAGSPETLTAMLNRWYAESKIGWTGWTTFLKSSTDSTGTKGGDNSGLVCTPSTNAVAGTDDYAGLPLFAVTHVNWELDNNGKKVITAIKGISSDYEQNNPEKYVGVTQQTAYVWYTEDATSYTYGYADGINAETTGNPKPLPEAIEPDNTINNFVLHSKYMSGTYNRNGTTLMTCCSGVPVRYNVSHNSLITAPDTIGTYYSGGTVTDWSFLVWMSIIKYGSLTQDNINQGCLNYDIQAYAKVAEQDVKRIIVSASDGAKFVVGSSIRIGSYTSTLDRANASTYTISGANGYTIASIESIDIDGTTYSAIYVNADTAFTTEANGDATDGTTFIITWHWVTGANDNILGNDGAMYNPASGLYPATIQGIEYSVGGYEVLADVILRIVDNAYRPYIARLASYQSNNITSNMVVSELSSALSGAIGWKYIKQLIWDGETFFAVNTTGATSSTFTRDAFYKVADTTADGSNYEWLSFGNLNNGVANGGLSYINGNNDLSNSNWNYLARLSGYILFDSQ